MFNTFCKYKKYVRNKNIKYFVCFFYKILFNQCWVNVHFLLNKDNIIEPLKCFFFALSLF